MKKITISPGGSLKGSVALPGDKSISHRSLLFNALASGPAKISGLLNSEDVEATRRAVEALGAKVARDGRDLVVHPPKDGLKEPEDVIDCGNSGTTIRLLTGALASQPFFSVLTGDSSLRRRPMKRVVDPLRRMGAVLDGRMHGDRPPLSVRGQELRMTHHDLKIASAQVKTALLLAGLSSGVAVREPRQSRDHTERLLMQMGCTLRKDAEDWLVLLPARELEPCDIKVPRDISAAAFFIVAANLVEGSEIFLENVGINPTRTGVLDALTAMGADVQIFPKKQTGPEPMADILARHSPLVGTTIEGSLAVRSLDELPIIAIAAAFAEGETHIRDAAELRVKESDRIGRVCDGLRAMGIYVDEREDGMSITGGVPLGGAEVNASGDHRIAMAFAVAGLCVRNGVTIDGANSISSSYPLFFAHLEALQQ